MALARPAANHGITVYDPKGIPLQLKQEDEIAHGGEGFIYRFQKNSEILIKVCKPETQADKSKIRIFRNRLSAMMLLEECRNADFLAWPLMPAVMDSHGGAVGFIMSGAAMLYPCPETGTSAGKFPARTPAACGLRRARASSYGTGAAAPGSPISGRGRR